MLDVMDKDEIRAGIVECYEKYAKGKKGIVYTINREHNIHVCARYVNHGYKAVAIDSETPPEERERLVEDFRRGKIDIICNVNIFSEGFDCPDLDFIQLARPTKSLSMYLQQVGRGLRPAEGKDHLIILDNVGLYNRFGFPSARRHWRYHFEGRPVDYSPGKGTREMEEREVIYMDDYVEGNEDVDMLHTSVDETIETEPQQVVENIYPFEPEFKYYLGRKGLEEKTISKIVRALKNDVDPIIKSKFNSKHTSILAINDLPMIKLYRQEIEEDSLMSEIDNNRKNILSETLLQYECFINWVLNGRSDSEFTSNTEEPNNIVNAIPDEGERTIEQVKAEIAIFNKYHSKVPAVLLQELDSFIKAEKQ